MILDFTVENYRSIYGKKTLTLEADKAIKECNDSNLFEHNKFILLKTLALYGANSSVKSNLVSAMYTMAKCVLSSVKLNDNEELDFDPFLLLKNNTKPTMFEVIFLKGNFCYRYGFRYNLEKIVEEWLFRKTTPRSKEPLQPPDDNRDGANSRPNYRAPGCNRTQQCVCATEYRGSLCECWGDCQSSRGTGPRWHPSPYRQQTSSA